MIFFILEIIAWIKDNALRATCLLNCFKMGKIRSMPISIAVSKKLFLNLYIMVMIGGLMMGAAIASTTDLGPTKNIFKIQSITIQGLKKVEKEAVLEKISSKEGMVLDNYLLRKDIKKIYDMKYFDHVEAQSQENGILVFVVKEKPIITDIIVEGNDEVSEDDLKEQIKTKKFSILDVNTVKNDIKSLQKFYEEKGFHLAAVDYKIQEVTKENIKLVFVVKEFDQVKVKKVLFLGNTAFNDDELKGIMETKEESVFSFMSGAGNFKEFNFQTDVERIKYFYKTKGYLQINVATPHTTISEDKRWVFITIKLTEGPQFSVNDISFQGEVLFSEEEIREKIKLKSNDIYSEETLRLDIQTLTEMYQDEGYAFANVLRTLQIVPGENKVDVEFSFEKGKIAYFGNIIVKGNDKTRDKVIRREILVREGRKFSGSLLRKSKENVERLGFFEPKSIIFNTITQKDKDDVLDLEVSVKERNTGQISLGAGYSTGTGGFLQASIAQTNLFGRGQNISFSMSLAENNNTFNVGFTEPYLFDSKWSAGGDIFRIKNTQSDSYDYKRIGFDLRVGYPIFEYTRLFFTYKFEDTTLSDVKDPTIDANTENGVASSVKTSLVFDKRNNRFEPTDGFYLGVSSEFAGVGGDKKWLRNDFDGRYYNNIYNDFVFRNQVYLAKMEEINSQEIPRTEKYTLGGPRNLRGYPYEAIGPKRTIIDDKGRPRTFNTGGLFSITSTFEVEHPLVQEAGLKWVVFYDIGNIYNRYIGEGGFYSFKQDYGFGIRWFSPIGVLRFEYGIPINPDKDTGGQFNFDIGQLF
ncbi:MAG: outer membrane protein assembly factor BamA [Bdellovibrionales bacterium RIFOXYB1_FULL_37_110]|nr:MAG: outer membrane protein assembly factor BamA [Bdellovibrionales bacterium RIFOXYC1_FULL_37_79]OFZ59266.1 MAG: outer membrane protein assembly factor BamA [Bdellovibrionales bacterium RIFOXYB1_FULL_37_110]OFZ62892.1 MAG: outer membrane protein assembly factor BamA [Bdellovibrionales bacterium RIFOXYD1_FULL_36_51]